jgi:hypothetical protein
MNREWVIVDRNRPWTANAERKFHHMKRAQTVRATRERWAWLALAERIPRLERIEVIAAPLAKDRRWRPDVAACYPAVKAAIDGLVDARVILDDDDSRLASIKFLPVEVVGYDGLRLTIKEAPC